LRNGENEKMSNPLLTSPRGGKGREGENEKKKELTGISCGLFMCLPNGAGIA